jgi:hypothetical protein
MTPQAKIKVSLKLFLGIEIISVLINRTKISSLPEDLTVEVIKYETENWKTQMSKLFITAGTLIALSGNAYASERKHDSCLGDANYCQGVNIVGQAHVDKFGFIGFGAAKNADISEQYRLDGQH